MMLLPFRRFADFNGRSRRSEFWLFFLLQLIVMFLLIALLVGAGGFLALSAGDTGQMFATGGVFAGILILGAVYWLVTLIPFYAVSVRRLHDSNRTGWWVFAPLLLGIATNIIAGAVGVAGDLGAAMILTGLLSAAGLVLNIIVLVFLCLDGTPGPNQFGHDPKHRGYEHTFA